MKNKQTSRQTFKPSLLSVAVIAGLGFANLGYASDKGIGDLEIYEAAQEGKITLTMMFDTSGSMSVMDYRSVNREACDLPKGVVYRSYSFNQENSGTTPNYKKSYCMGSDNKKYYDRITRLKDAVFALMDSKDLTENQVSIGVGQYSSSTLTVDGRPYGDSSSGRILVPAAPLSDAQRLKIKTAVANLSAGGTTPSAAAYAETGAYMLGTTTQLTAAEARPIGSIPLGFKNSSADTKNSTGTAYKSPLPDTPASCDGQGIYFLTDGVPNYANQPEIMMGKALELGRALPFGTPGVNTLPQGSSRNQNGVPDSGTPQVGAFAKALRDANQNPKGVSIRTAVVGFGSIFDTSRYTNIQRTLRVPELDLKTSMPIEGKFQDKTAVYFDCSKIPEVDARNACNWGAKSHPELPKTVGGYGEGGFYSAQSTQDVVASVKEFLGILNNSISATPAGTISIPSDPLSASNIQPYAYLPMLQPEVAKDFATWEGNLKKYHTLYGTLYGKNRQRLYINAKNPTQGNDEFPSALNPRAEDIWQEGATGNNASIMVGGSRNKLKHPTTANKANIRSVYVETKDAADKVTMVKVGIANGTTLVNFDKLDSRYTIVDMAYLVNYLGFDVPVEEKDYVGTTIDAQRQALQTLLGNASVNPKVNHGGVLHSVPVLASYGGKYDATTGNISSDEAQREDHLLYGSMDGALHMVNARDGSENFAFIPRAMFDDVEQRHALKADSKRKDRKIGSPKFGVDGPWSINANYNITDTGMKATKMFAYGGLRMGGVGFYGLDITNRDDPKLAFSINKSAGFERLGQTWSKPLVANIKTGPNILTDTKKVLIFGGGYDMCYENPKFKLGDDTNTDANCKNKAEADGNAVYMIDAEKGTLLQTWTANSTTDGRQHMKHSIVSEIVGRDRDNDGNIDHLYFSDLGGQVFRIDLRSGMPANNTHLTRRVVRLFDANAGTMPANHLPFRFYEQPAVSIHDTDSGTIGMVAISSGDRSSPKHTHRELADANRIFGIIDRDVGNYRGNSNTPMDELLTNNLTSDDLNAYVTKDLVGDGNKSKRAKFIDALIKGDKHGWFYTMTRFDKYENIKNLKSVGSSVTRGNIYYASVYNPDYNYTQVAGCSAKVLGGTERQLFCLPWGICAAPDGTLAKEASNGTLGYIKAGPGIQELAVSTFTNTEGRSTNMTVLVGQMTFKEAGEAAKNNNTGTGGSGNPMANNVLSKDNLDGGNPLTESPIPEERRFMKIERWYDLAQAENIQ